MHDIQCLPHQGTRLDAPRRSIHVAGAVSSCCRAWGACFRAPSDHATCSESLKSEQQRWRAAGERSDGHVSSGVQQSNPESVNLSRT